MGTYCRGSARTDARGYAFGDGILTMTLTGRIAEHLVVDSEVTVQGALLDGATVRRGGVLVVQGAVDGALVVEAGGMVNIQGAIDGAIAMRGGLVLIAGVMNAIFDDVAGTFCVCVGTVINSPAFSSQGILLADNTIHALIGSDQRIDIDAGTENYRRFDFENGRFGILSRTS